MRSGSYGGPAKTLAQWAAATRRAGCWRHWAISTASLGAPDAPGSTTRRHFASLAGNTPFAGRTVRGQVKATLRDGSIVYRIEE